jgi:hypothetical protein
MEVKMTDKMMMSREAAEYTGTTPDYLLNQAKAGRLAYLQPSPKKIMFRRGDLDVWVKGWRTMAATTAPDLKTLAGV